jgi:alkylation response protein AidB-like acyl-CoA dehydrogenase
MTAALADFRVAAREWLSEHAGHAPPNYGAILPPERHAEGVAWQRRLFDAGWAGLHWPVEHGGRGLTPEHTAVWIDECSRADVPPFLNMVGLVLAGGALLEFGTPAQQRELLRPTLAGEVVWCQLFSEPGAGSDLASLSTRADADDDEHFVVNGQKVWCSGGRCSDWGILLARTSADAPKHRGISFFVVPMASPGIEVRPLRQMTGAAEFDEVFFTDVALPADRLVGPLHDGWRVAMSVLTNERGHIGATVRGVQRRVDRLASAGREGSLDPVHRQRLVKLVAEGTAYTRLAQRGATAPSAVSLMKLGVTELLYAAAMLGGDLAGAAATTDDPSVAGMLGAPGGRIAGGTSQIQRNIIGERLLGLPKEPA